MNAGRFLSPVLFCDFSFAIDERRCGTAWDGGLMTATEPKSLPARR